MKTMKTPVIDRQKKTITVAKDFLIQAGQFGTQEFNILSEMKQTHPGYTVEVRKITRNPDKRAYGELTYETMENFIRGRESKDTVNAVLKEFEAVRRVSRTMRASYPLVKKWFLGKYGEEFKAFQDAQDEKKRATAEIHLLPNNDNDN